MVPCSIPVRQKLTTLNEMYPLMEEVLAAGGTFSLTVTGNSMWPTIGGNRDKVTLMAPPKQWKCNDLPLYQRKNGQFILHRIVRVHKNGTVDCCGDHQYQVEKGIAVSQLRAIVVSIERKGKIIPTSGRGYRAWVWLWWLLRPVRPMLFFADSLRRRILKNIQRKIKDETE